MHPKRVSKVVFLKTIASGAAAPTPIHAYSYTMPPFSKYLYLYESFESWNIKNNLHTIIQSRHIAHTTNKPNHYLYIGYGVIYFPHTPVLNQICDQACPYSLICLQYYEDELLYSLQSVLKQSDELYHDSSDKRN